MEMRKQIQNNLSKIVLGVWTAFICMAPGFLGATPITDLFSGGSYTFDNLVLSDWDLVNAGNNVGLNDLDIGPGYGSAGEVSLEATNLALNVGRSTWGTPVTLNFSYDFLVTGVGVDISSVRGDLGLRSISGFDWDTPWLKGTIEVGTSKGSSDLGSTTDIYSFNQDTTPAWIDLTDGVDQIWVRNTIALSSGGKGYARAGYNDNSTGVAFRNRFVTQVSQSPVPEPNTMVLLGVGLLFFSAKMRKNNKYFHNILK